MKNMIKRVMLMACALTVLFMLNSCAKESPLEASSTSTDLNVANAVDYTEELEEIIAPGAKDEVLRHVNSRGVNTDMVEEVIQNYPDGTSAKVYMVDGCIAMTREQLNATMNQDLDGRQYSTNNLVSNNQTITVIGYTGGSNALTSRMRTGLSWAIDNYNALNIGLSFSLSFATSTNADIVVYKVNSSGAGGSAGFPSGGNPYKWVQILSGTNNYSNNVNEHVIGHEIGHCLGLRHTDYFSRQSCGQNTNEGSAGVGANYIPGTPSGYDANSLMLACFNSSEDGEFGFYDVVALEYLY